MTEPIELALPCRLVSLEVSLASDDELSTLENLVAKAVLLGYRSVGAIKSFFGLPERLASDVVTSMWEKGFIVVDLEEGVFDLSEAARSSLTDGGSIASGPRNETQTYVFEPLSGLVLPEEDRNHDIGHWARHDSLKVPVDGGIRPDDIAEEELIRGVQVAVNRRREWGRRENVLRVSFGNRLLRPPNLVRWLHVQATVTKDVHSRTWSVAVNHRGWDAEAQLRLGKRLRRLLDEAPDSEFARALNRRAAVELHKPVMLDELFTTMAARVDALESTPPGQLRLQHPHLASLAGRIEQRLDQLERTNVEVTPVTNRMGQEWAVRDLIESSRQQLVLVVPDLVYRQLNVFLGDLRAALGRGVRLIVLWGRAADASLPTDVQSALLSDLGHRFPGQILVSPASCQTDACLVIQDDERALVTSFSALGDVRSAERIGLVLRSAEGSDGPAQSVVDLLMWSRKAFRDYALQRRISVFAAEFDRPASSAHPWPMVEERPGALPDHPDEADIRLWSASWRSLLLSLQEQRARLADRTAARVLIDGENRDAFWELLRGAHRRLVVADDRIDPAVADLALASAIRECQGRDTAIQLIYPSSAANDPQDPFQPLARGPDRVPVRSDRAEARLVLSDGSTLIGSFSPLADGEGRFRHRAQRRSQVGVLVDGEAVTTEMAALLRAVPAARPPAPTPLVPVAHDDSRTRELSLLREMRQAKDGRQIAELVSSRLRQLDQPWTVLRNLVDARTPAEALRPAIAAALLAGIAGDGDRDQCSAWLITDAWERRAFVEGAMIAPLLGDDQVSLAWAAGAAAALEIGPLDAFLGDLTLELAASATSDGGAVLVAAAASIAESLLWQDSDGCAAAFFLSSRLPDAWRAFTDVVIANYSAAEGELPLRTVLHEQSRRSSMAELEAERAHILDLVARIEQLRTRFLFPAGRVLYRELLAPEGLLTRVKAAAGTDLKAVAALGPSIPDDVRVYLDKFISLDHDAPAMVWSRQLGWLRSMEEIVSGVLRISPEALAQTGAGPVVELPAGQAAIATHLAANWDRLFSEADGLGAPWRHPPLALMDHLEPVVVWARGRP
jgi:hypothetical protein